MISSMRRGETVAASAGNQEVYVFGRLNEFAGTCPLYCFFYQMAADKISSTHRETQCKKEPKSFFFEI